MDSMGFGLKKIRFGEAKLKMASRCVKENCRGVGVKKARFFLGKKKAFWAKKKG